MTQRDVTPQTEAGKVLLTQSLRAESPALREWIVMIEAELRRSLAEKVAALNDTGYGPSILGADAMQSAVLRLIEGSDPASPEPHDMKGERVCPDCGFTASRIGDFHINAQEAAPGTVDRLAEASPVAATEPRDEPLDLTMSRDPDEDWLVVTDASGASRIVAHDVDPAYADSIVFAWNTAGARRDPSAIVTGEAE